MTGQGGARHDVVVVFGETLVDAFAEAELAGGAPFNVACHLAGLGLEPLLVSRIGVDAAAQEIDAVATRCGLRMDGVQRDPGRATGRVLVHEDTHGHRFEILPDQAYDHIDAGEAVNMLAALPCAWEPERCWMYAGTLALRGADSHAALEALSGALRPRRFVDLNWREAGTPPGIALQAVKGAEVLKLNAEELALMCRWLELVDDAPGVQASMRQSTTIARLAGALSLRAVLLTRGEQGATAWTADGVLRARQPAIPAGPVVDTVGAGDAFAAAMLAALAGHRDLADAMAFAAHFAAASCGLRGALPAGAGFYEPWREALAALPAR